jgi:hypothetical protein
MGVLKRKEETLALEAIGAALPGGRAEHEAIRTLRRGSTGQVQVLLRRPAQPRPGNCKDGHRLDRQEGSKLCAMCAGIERRKASPGPYRSR